MKPVIVLDSGPLGLIVHKQRIKQPDACKAWVSAKLQQGVKFFVPEIVDFEVRRELLRIGLTAAVADLDSFNSAVADRYIRLDTATMRSAAQLWATARQQGKPTAHNHELDVDVIAAAQALSLGLPSSDYVMATSNPYHLSRFAPADLWTNL